MITISKNERKFLVVVILITLFFVLLPIIVGYSMTPKGSTYAFRGSTDWIDYPVYFSYIEQVKSGQLLFKNLFTSEHQTFLVFNPFWLTIGVFAKLFALPAGVAFQLAKALLVPILLIVAYFFVALFFEEEFKRKICFLFLVFSSSIILPVYSFFFSTMYQSPHLIASLLLIILIFFLSIKVFENSHQSNNGAVKLSLWAGFFSLILFSFHPYHLPTIFGVLFAFIAVDSIKNKKIEPISTASSYDDTSGTLLSSCFFPCRQFFIMYGS